MSRHHRSTQPAFIGSEQRVIKISLDDIYEGEVIHEVLRKLLKQRELESFGYITL